MAVWAYRRGCARGSGKRGEVELRNRKAEQVAKRSALNETHGPECCVCKIEAARNLEIVAQGQGTVHGETQQIGSVDCTEGSAIRAKKPLLQVVGRAPTRLIWVTCCCCYSPSSRSRPPGRRRLRSCRQRCLAGE